MEDKVSYTSHRLPPRHERTKCDYLFYIPRATAAFFVRVVAVFNLRFVLFLGVSQFFLKGIAYYLSRSIMLPLFKSVIQADAMKLQLYVMLCMVPWSIKPLIGVCSDIMRIGGYHKRYWLFGAMALGSICAGFLFLGYANKSGIGLALCLMGVQFQIALFDLFSESAFSEIVRDHPYTGSDIITLVQGFQQSGGFIAVLLIGLLADGGYYKTLFSFVAGVIVTPLVPSLFNWLLEKKHAGTSVFQLVNRAQLYRDRWFIGLVAATGLAAPLVALIVNAVDPAVGLAVAILLTMAIVLAAFKIADPIIARVALLQVILSVGSPRLGGALDYFYTADETCVPGGPHFSYAYYLTYAGVAGTLSSIAGVIVYQAVFSRFRFRTVLVITTLMCGFIGMSDLFIVLRLNVRMGIPDRAAYILGEAVMEPLMEMLQWIPVSALISKVVPKGMESSSFAFMAGISNFSSMIAELSGALLFETVGIKTTGVCNFEKLWILILVCHVLMPIVTGVPAIWLIPNVYQTEALTSEPVPTEIIQSLTLEESSFDWEEE